MKLADILTIAAIVLAPIFALRVQVWLEHVRAYSRRQHEVFRMLMATRGTRLSGVHIEALNRIDLDFYGRRAFWFRLQGRREKAVVKAWRAYRSHLSSEVPQGDTSAYFQKRWDLFLGLLEATAIACGYDFDQTDLVETSYTPKYFDTVEREAEAVRRGAIDVLSGSRAIGVSLIMPDAAVAKHVAVQDAILSQVGPEGVLRVRLVSDPPASAAPAQHAVSPAVNGRIS